MIQYPVKVLTGEFLHPSERRGSHNFDGSKRIIYSTQRDVAAGADTGMEVRSDIGQYFPAAGAFRAFGDLEDYTNTVHFRQLKCFRRHRIGRHANSRSDAHIVEINRFHRLQGFGVRDIYDRRCLKRGPDDLTLTLDLQRTGDDGSHLSNLGPFSGQLFVQPIRRGVGHVDKVHRRFRSGKTRKPIPLPS